MSDPGRTLSFAERRGSTLSEELILDTSASMSDPRLAKMTQSRHVRGPPTPSMSTPAADFDQQLVGSPPPPPTPAASPGPSHCQPDWSGAADDEDFFLAKVRQHFKNCSGPQRTRILADLLNLCTSPQLSFVHQHVSPLLKKDPFTSLPDELCLRILSFIDDPKVLARASQVSPRWRDLLSDDMTWKNLCLKHDYRRHVMGVWAMVPWGDTLVSGGCDRDVRVWDLRTGHCLHTLRGHTSTVRCLKMADENTAISGSRDTTLRIWDIRSGLCRNVLVGHQSSVRCLEIHGDIVVSGSYDTFARVWSISEGRCLQTLQGHFSQIYAIAFDGKRVVTGSLDTNVRIWDPFTGECLAILQGHTSLVGQLQMRGDTLVTGGSDGSVRVWSLEKMCPIHRLAAHDNSVTSLQFDDTRIVSGGSDGRVKIWDLKTGLLVRELIAQGEAVWRVAFEAEKCVALALRQGRTVMEVWTFTPPDEVIFDRPPTIQQRVLEDDPSRPLSAMVVDYTEPSSSGSSSQAANQDQDIDMTEAEAGPSTGNKTFFHED
ncbi:uncharacterized protein J7T54_000785 [Emericellopsis cladophorae]|uniref:F-box domain-containing protein n=1 Tax=Emericellopsis cladophorae TaxID=2686198 RepID=A0A9P9XVE2_9HYPO|nr:uncharacterized protein J7T54_000785 [Emericellopsis cladophorae]KAI6778396.1 hypothetical protein J7T54_000785 [Emericellopsis cladophorae]